MRMRVLVVLAVATLAAVSSTALATPTTVPIKPSWRCIAGVCLGNSRASIVYRFGGIVDNRPSVTIQVPGGKVWACYWRCQGAVTEDGFTYWGGTARPANRVMTVSTCNPIVQLPDGVRVGTRIPFGDRWHGYKRIDLYEPGPRPGWERYVLQGAKRTRVVLDPQRGRVLCLYLEAAKA